MDRRPGEPELRQWAAAAVDGDPVAVRALVRALQDLISAYCRGRLHQLGHGVADDVVQETCIAVLRRLAHLVETGQPMLPYVFRVAQNKVADAFRDAVKRSHQQLDDTVTQLRDIAPGPEDAALRGDLARELARALAVLGEREQEVVGLRVLGGLPAADVARILGMTEGNVRVTQHRALAKLRTELAPVQGPATA
ncbi:sigma-70 family RNA polymerase sigma factor [Pseudonocardia sp.]|uniref:sigma-70 family RNA polymerase sigma factor n=1 Tax=Pseudonocardia sp. TaxID=60912 RepID=UPI003D14572D